MQSKEVYINPSLLKTFEYENSKFCSAFDFRLTKRDLEIAHCELNELEDTKKDCIQKLKERLERDEKLVYRTDDDYLLRYLRFSKFNCDKAYKSIRKLHELRIKYPGYFRLHANMEDLLNANFVTFLPYKDEERRIIFKIDYRNWIASERNFSNMMPTCSAMFDVVSANPHCQINGFVGILDFQGFTVQHLLQSMQSPMPVFSSSFLQECYPWRIKRLFFINCNAVVKIGYAALRPLFKKKIVDRLRILGSDLTELHQYMNPALLPKEYGGTLQESECSITGLIMDNMDYLKYERSFELKSNNKPNPIK